MDQFGVLVGNSASLAQLKSKPPKRNPISNFTRNIDVPLMPDFVVGDLDDIFCPTPTHKKKSSGTHIGGGVSSPSNATPNEIAAPESTTKTRKKKLFHYTLSPPRLDNLFRSGVPDLLHPNSTYVRSDVKLSQPSSSPADDPFSVPEPLTTSISKPIPQKKEPVFGGSFPGGQKPASSTSDFISLEGSI